MSQTPQNKVGILLENNFGEAFSSRYPSGNRPSSGGTAAFAWSATQLEDGGIIRITSNTHTFTQPDKYVWLGHGDGWLEDQTDGTMFQDLTIPTALGNESIDYEDPAGTARRLVYTLNGRKYLRSVLTPDNAGTANAGFINWDTGSTIPALQHVFMYSRARATPAAGHENELIQLKQERIGQNPNIDGNDWNSFYYKQDPGNSQSIIDSYEGTSVVKNYAFGNNGVRTDGKLTTQLINWKINTADANDGHLYVSNVKDGVYTKSTPLDSGNAATGIIRSNASELPRRMKHQGYRGNNSTMPTLELLITDIFWQRGGSIFVLADNTTLSSATCFCPLVPTAFNGGNDWSLRLWRGEMSNYRRACLILLDSALNQVASVNIGGD